MKTYLIIYLFLGIAGTLSSCIEGKSEGQGKPAIDSIGDTLADRNITIPKAEKLSKEEQVFLFAAATGNNMEIEAGNLAAVQSKNREIISFGKQMVNVHRRVAEELTEVAKKLKINITDSLTTEQSRQLNQLTTLDDPAFDKQYMTMMIAEHAKTIKLLQEGANLPNISVSAFAAKILPTINAHHKTAVEIGRRLNFKNTNNGDDIAGKSPAPGHIN